MQSAAMGRGCVRARRHNVHGTFLTTLSRQESSALKAVRGTSPSGGRHRQLQLYAVPNWSKRRSVLSGTPAATGSALVQGERRPGLKHPAWRPCLLVLLHLFKRSAQSVSVAAVRHSAPIAPARLPPR
jgi:hypothetical protein